MHVGETLAEILPYFDRERVERGARLRVLVCIVAKLCADTTDIRGSEAKYIQVNRQYLGDASFF